MSDLVKLLGSFFRRDLLYFMAGSFVLTALVFAQNNNELPKLPDYIFIILSFLAYIIGYVLQELFAVMRFVTVRDVRMPGMAFDFFNWRVFRASKSKVERLRALSDDCLDDLQHCYWSMSTKLDIRLVDQIERFLTLRQIGSSFGPSLIITPLVYLVAAWAIGNCTLPPNIFYVALLSIFCGAFLCAQTHYRATQVALALMQAFPDKISRTSRDSIQELDVPME